MRRSSKVDVLIPRDGLRERLHEFVQCGIQNSQRKRRVPNRPAHDNPLREPKHAQVAKVKSHRCLRVS